MVVSPAAVVLTQVATDLGVLREICRAFRCGARVALTGRGVCAATRRPERRPERGALADPTTATLIALRAPGRRHQQLSAEIGELDALITPLVTQINPALCALLGVGPDVAGQLLVTAADTPERLRSEAAFAMLCGAAPLPASSGRTQRHRLHRGGDRHANAALYRIVLCRLRWDPRTRAYAARRTAEGMSRKRSSAASNATSPARSTPPCSTPTLPPSRPALAPRRRSQACSARSAARTNDVDTDKRRKPINPGGRARPRPKMIFSPPLDIHRSISRP